jgi:sulfite oxidase
MSALDGLQLPGLACGQVTYKDGVYDVTDFLDMHPGGAQRLMLAAGGAIDPFWAMYAQHNTAEVQQMLEGYRIGKLVHDSRHMLPSETSRPACLNMQVVIASPRPGRAQAGGAPMQQVADPYANEPKRHPALVVRSQQPFNAETPVDVLGTAKLTPNELFYVRNHLPVPHVDAATWTVRAPTCAADNRVRARDQRGE